MKKKSLHFSKSALSVTLALCMLLSCLYVGLIPTDAAKVEVESVGYTEYNLTSSNVFYFDNTQTQWSSVKLMVMKKTEVIGPEVRGI